MDEFLITRAKKGHKDSFTQAIMQIKDQAYRVAYCYLHNEEDSMDAVCDAVEQAYKNIRKLKNVQYFNTWFIRIVINECNAQLRLRQRTTKITDHLEFPEVLGPSEDKLDLEILLNKLSPGDRLLIYMKYYLGYTLDEIAQLLDMSSGTVKTRIYSNLKKMKSELQTREVY